MTPSNSVHSVSVPCLGSAKVWEQDCLLLRNYGFENVVGRLFPEQEDFENVQHASYAYWLSKDNQLDTITPDLLENISAESRRRSEDLWGFRSATQVPIELVADVSAVKHRIALKQRDFGYEGETCEQACETDLLTYSFILRQPQGRIFVTQELEEVAEGVEKENRIPWNKNALEVSIQQVWNRIFFRQARREWEAEDYGKVMRDATRGERVTAIRLGNAVSQLINEYIALREKHAWGLELINNKLMDIWLEDPMQWVYEGMFALFNTQRYSLLDLAHTDDINPDYGNKTVALFFNPRHPFHWLKSASFSEQC